MPAAIPEGHHVLEIHIFATEDCASFASQGDEARGIARGKRTATPGTGGTAWGPVTALALTVAGFSFLAGMATGRRRGGHSHGPTPPPVDEWGHGDRGEEPARAGLGKGPGTDAGPRLEAVAVSAGLLDAESGPDLAIGRAGPGQPQEECAWRRAGGAMRLERRVGGRRL